MNEKNWSKWSAVTITVAGVLVALYFFFKLLFPLLLPFLLAFLLAALTHPLAKRFAARTGFREKVVSAAFTLLALLLFGGAVYLLFSRLLFELQSFLVRLGAVGEDGESELSRLVGAAKAIFSRLPDGLGGAWLENIIGDPEEFFAEQLKSVIARTTEALPRVVGGILRALPRVALFFLVTLVACFYFSMDFDKIKGAMYAFLPPAIKKRTPRLCQRAKGAALRYLRAYFLLFLLTFLELVLGFLILRIEYVFLFALVVALLDILPILGVGTVLLPYAVISFLGGNTPLGVGLLVLYIVITVIRQTVEPHLVGKSLGLHPILMLFALYAGIRLFGIVGILAGPLLVLLLKALLQRESEGEEKEVA